MNEELIELIINNEIKSVPIRTTVGEALQADSNSDILGGFICNDAVGLDTPLTVPVNLSPITRSSREGQRILINTGSLILEYVLAKHFKEYHFQIGQSFNQGCYYELLGTDDGEVPDMQSLAARIDDKVSEIVKADTRLNTRVANVEAASVLLKDSRGYMIKLLESWPYSWVTLSELDKFFIIQHCPITPSAKYCKDIHIVPHAHGIIMQFNRRKQSPSQSSNERLISAYRENRDWNRMIGVSTVGELNEAILSGRISEVIKVQEGLHEKKIANIADQIADRKDKVKLICIAGPSSSGKTTFLKRLSVQLKVAGIDPVTISLDDYYLNREDRPRDANGNIDYESLHSLDVPLLTGHLQTLISGGEIMVPRFDFHQGKRANPDKFTPLQLGNNQILLIEGIHGLNPAIADSVPPEFRFRIFVSALTQLIVDENTRIPTSDARLLRRIVRDRRYRKTSAAETIALWPGVRDGERKNIFPFQENCDVMFNSSLVYETAVLKTFAQRYLLEVPRTDPARRRAQPLLRFLDMFVPLFPDDIPSNSLLREFIGGSNFAY